MLTILHKRAIRYSVAGVPYDSHSQ